MNTRNQSRIRTNKQACTKRVATTQMGKHTQTHIGIVIARANAAARMRGWRIEHSPPSSGRKFGICHIATPERIECAAACMEDRRSLSVRPLRSLKKGRGDLRHPA